MKHGYKTWKGFVAITKPNKHRCRFCDKINSDWKEIVELENFNPFVHRLCQFKVGHYGFTPEQYSKWKCEYNLVRNKVLSRDNNLCVKCKNKCENCKRDLFEKGTIRLNVHHIIAVRDGGTNDMKNLITVCQFCNRMLDNKRHLKLQ
jgi:hypothetical protein